MCDKVIFEFYSEYLNCEYELNKKTTELCKESNLDGLAEFFLNQYTKGHKAIIKLEKEFMGILGVDVNEIWALILSNIKPLIHTHLAFINAYYNISERISFSTLVKLYFEASGIQNLLPTNGNNIYKTDSLRLQKVLSRQIGIDDEYIRHIKNGCFFQDRTMTEPEKSRPTNSLIKYYADICYYILDSSNKAIDESTPDYSVYKSIKSLNYSKFNKYSLNDIINFYEFIDKCTVGNKYLQLHFLEKLFGLNLFKDILCSKVQPSSKKELVKCISVSVNKYGYNKMHKKIIDFYSEVIYERDVISAYNKEMEILEKSDIHFTHNRDGKSCGIKNYEEYCKCISDEDIAIIDDYIKTGDTYLAKDCTVKIDKYFHNLSNIVFEKTLGSIIKFIESLANNDRRNYAKELFEKNNTEEACYRVNRDAFNNKNVKRYYLNAFHQSMILKNTEQLLEAAENFKEIIKIDVDDIKNNVFILYEFQRILYISKKIKNICQKETDQNSILNIIDYIENTQANLNTPYVKPFYTKGEMKYMLIFINNLKMIQRKIKMLSLEKILFLSTEGIDESTRHLTVYEAIILCRKELGRCCNSLSKLKESIDKKPDRETIYPSILDYESYVHGLWKIIRDVRLPKDFDEYTYDAFLEYFKADYFREYLKSNPNTVT